MTVTCHGTRNYADAIKVPNKLTTKKGIILDEPVLNKETIRDLKEKHFQLALKKQTTMLWRRPHGRDQQQDSQSRRPH